MSREQFRDERIREEFLKLHRSTVDEGNCPSLEILWESARAELDNESNEEVILHLGECPACAAAWRFAGEAAPVEAPAAFPASPGGRLARPGFRIAAAAAVLVIGAGLGWLYFGPDRITEPAYRTQESLVLQPVAEGDAPLNRERCVLRWTPGPEGTRYQVRVTGDDLTVLANGKNLNRPEFLVPESALDGMPPGSTILWQVTADLPDGRHIESKSYSAKLE
jgi:hypothetical protein